MKHSKSCSSYKLFLAILTESSKIIVFELVMHVTSTTTISLSPSEELFNKKLPSSLTGLLYESFTSHAPTKQCPLVKTNIGLMPIDSRQEANNTDKSKQVASF